MKNPDKSKSQGERLAEARRARGFDTAKDAAKYFGWPYATYSQHERGERGLRKDMAQAYAKNLRVSASWLMLGEGTMKSPNGPEEIPIYGKAGAREVVNLIESDDHTPIDTVTPLRAEDGFHAVIVDGASMLPTYRDGDFLFFLAIPIFAPPTYFTEIASKNGIFVTGYGVYFSEKAIGFIKNPDKKNAKLISTFNPSVICREIAKIAHGSAAAIIGLDNFDPFLTELITGKTEDISTYIGGRLNHVNEKTDELHQIYIEINRGLIIGHIRLFSSLGVGGYTAVIGTMK